MAMLSSSDIRVYPSSKRVGVDPGAKFTTEYNLTNLINRLTNRQAFVITDKVLLNAESITNFEFNILGYYFLVNLPKSILSKATTDNHYLNASITISQKYYGDTNNFYNWWQLEGQDLGDDPSTKQFSGLQLSWDSMTSHFQKDNQSLKNLSGVWEELDPVSGNPLYTFTILQRTNSGYMIPPDSKIRLFTSTNGEYRGVSIDDGELTAEPSSNTLNLRKSVREIIKPTAINLNTAEIELEKSATFQLGIICEPENASIDTVEFRTSDSNVATISADGLITAIDEGNCFIIANIDNLTAVCQVRVVSEIIDEESIAEDDVISKDETLQDMIEVIEDDTVGQSTDISEEFSNESDNPLTDSDTQIAEPIVEESLIEE